MIKILYVEDEPFLAKIVCETLQQNNFQVTHITDGLKAIETFMDKDFDIYVLDIMLPNKNGYQIAEEIRAKNKTTPIIFLSAKSQTEDVISGFESGGNDYLKKPFSMEELIARINNLLRFSPQKQLDSDEIIIGKHFKFNSKKHLLEHREQSIQLSYKENQLLKALVHKVNAIVERKELLINIWGDDNYFNSRNLDVYIRKLRKHFDREPTVQIITLKGVGYRFVVDQ